jgi:hypothetical protein
MLNILLRLEKNSEDFSFKASISVHFLNFSLLYYSNKLVFVHNVAAYNPEYELDEHEDMWEIEMPIDADLFEGDTQDIEIGDFVFRPVPHPHQP